MSAVAALLRAIAILLRRPADMRWQGRVREDMWGDNQPLLGGNHDRVPPQDAR